MDLALGPAERALHGWRLITWSALASGLGQSHALAFGELRKGAGDV